MLQALCYLALVPCVLGKASETEYPTPSKPPFYLITDYLPVAIYERDSVVGCFRVENTTGAEARLELVSTAYDEKGQTISERAQAFTAPATGFGQVQGTQGSGGCAKITFLVRKGQEAVGAVTVRLLREADAWPPSLVRAGRLMTADGSEVIIPMVVRRAKKEEERAFAAVKWLLKTAEQGGGGGRTLFFVPERWRLTGVVAADASKVSGKDAPAEMIMALGPYEPNGAPPILRAVSQILAVLCADADAGNKEAWAQVLICLPPEDLDVATDPRVYRVLLEALLTRAAGLQAGKVLVVPPFQYGAPAKNSDALWREVSGAASACGVSAVDPAEYVEEPLWRVDPAVEGVYGIRPNAAGLKKIEQGLLNLVR